MRLLNRLIGRAKAVQTASESYQAYAVRSKHAQDQDTALNRIQFLVLDTETTGLDYKQDHIVSCALVPVNDSQIQIRDCMEWAVRSSVPSSPTSIRVHGVLNTELDAGMSEMEFGHQLLRQMSNEVIVGYHPGFDMAILNRLLKKHHGGALGNPVLDIARLVMRLDYPLKPAFLNPEPYSFDRLCKRFHVEASDRHTAIGDAYATALLLLRVLEVCRQHGLLSLRELLRPYT